MRRRTRAHLPTVLPRALTARDARVEVAFMLCGVCGHVSSYNAEVGVIICVHCRALEMCPSSLGTEQTLVKAACRSMLIDMAKRGKRLRSEHRRV